MAAVDLTSVQAVRDFLQKPDADENQDLIIAALITHASNLIMRDTQRQFAPAETAASHDFTYTGTGHLSLAPYDLRTVTTVVFDTDTSSTTTLTTDQYRLRPKPNPDGVYLWLDIDRGLAGGNTVFKDREVRITGNWGFASVPDEIAHWCNLTVSDWMRLNVQAFSRTFSIDEGRIDLPQSLPSSVRAGLAGWRRMGHG